MVSKVISNSQITKETLRNKLWEDIIALHLKEVTGIHGQSTFSKVLGI